MSKLVWVTNTRKLSSLIYIFPHKFFVQDTSDAALGIHEQINKHIDWYNSHIEGEPKASEHYTLEQMEEHGLVGLYKEADNETN